MLMRRGASRSAVAAHVSTSCSPRSPSHAASTPAPAPDRRRGPQARSFRHPRRPRPTPPRDRLVRRSPQPMRIDRPVGLFCRHLAPPDQAASSASAGATRSGRSTGVAGKPSRSSLAHPASTLVPGRRSDPRRHCGRTRAHPGAMSRVPQPRLPEPRHPVQAGGTRTAAVPLVAAPSPTSSSRSERTNLRSAMRVHRRRALPRHAPQPPAAGARGAGLAQCAKSSSATVKQPLPCKALFVQSSYLTNSS
jgi:hypothetical protein